ncbi:MAG: hypothetical protein OXC19_09270 [Bryobacterales bacterium]|nr:hypothetical protein [Bryobacterales bacterium]
MKSSSGGEGDSQRGGFGVRGGIDHGEARAGAAGGGKGGIFRDLDRGNVGLGFRPQGLVQVMQVVGLQIAAVLSKRQALEQAFGGKRLQDGHGDAVASQARTLAAAGIPPHDTNLKTATYAPVKGHR